MISLSWLLSSSVTNIRVHRAQNPHFRPDDESSQDRVQATLVAAPDEPLALDSKTLRGARTGTESAPHLLAFCTQQSHETVLQVAFDEKTNEIPVAQALLPTLPLARHVYTANALHTQTAFMRIVHEQQADTVLLVKENQPTLLPISSPILPTLPPTTRKQKPGIGTRDAVKCAASKQVPN